jgi:FHS family L-fucose permease-like MFS transporter
MASQSAPSSANATPNYTGPFVTVTALFFIFGFITNLNMALVPHLRSVFDLSYSKAMLAESAFFLAYLVFSAPTARLIEIIGYKRTMVTSLLIQAVGACLFVPAARLLSFPLFLTAIFVLGAGITALQTSANPYVSILGPEASAPVRLNLAQAANSIGGILAPLAAGAFILTASAGSASKAAIANTVRLPYLFIAGGLAALGVAVAFVYLPPISGTQSVRSVNKGDPFYGRSIWSYRHTVLGTATTFLFVGVEVGLASIMVNYFRQQGIPTAQAASSLIAFYWGGQLLGRLAGAWLLSRISAGRLLGIFGIAATTLVLVSMITTGHLAIWSLILCGLFNSIMFPNIFTLGIAGLGPLTSKGSGLILTAAVGGGVIPFLLGALADEVGIQHALILPVACYLFITHYGFSGSRQSDELAPAEHVP